MFCNKILANLKKIMQKVWKCGKISVNYILEIESNKDKNNQ